MEVDLRPLSLGDILDGAFDLYKRNFALFAGVTAVIHIPTQIVLGALTYYLGVDRLDTLTPGDPQYDAFVVEMLLVLCAAAMTAVAEAGVLTIAVSDRYLGRDCGILQAYRRLRAHLLRLELTWALIGAVWFAAVVILLLILSLGLGLVLTGAGTTRSPEAGRGAVVAVAVVLVFGALALLIAMGAFATQVTVMEGSGYFRATRRNWALISGRYRRVLTACVCLLAATLVLQSTVHGSVLFVLDGLVYPWAGVPSLYQRMIAIFWGGLLALLIQPF